MTPRLARCWIAVPMFLVVALGCGPAVHVEEPSPFDEDDPRAQPSGPGHVKDRPTSEGEDEMTDALPAGARASRQGTRRTALARATVDAALDRGPGSFLHGVELAPHFRDGRFDGWRIVQFMPGETRFAAYDLRPGDVIGVINGRLIERPQEMAALWDELRLASAIVVAIERDGKRFELRVDIDATGPQTLPRDVAPPPVAP